MAIADMINEVKKSLEATMHDRRFKKANMKREEKAALVAEVAKCSGKLAMCRNNFRTTIKKQSMYIAEGVKNGFDTIPQEQILWDAAVGYMLVTDAMFALKSLSSYDSVTQAYEMLDAAAKRASGQNPGLAKGRGSEKKGRPEYGYIGSADAAASKEELLNGFFAQLKQTGDIEACLESAKHPAVVESERRNIYLAEGGSCAVPAMSGGMDLDAMLDSIPGSEEESDFGNLENTAMLNITPPGTGK